MALHNAWKALGFVAFVWRQAVQLYKKQTAAQLGPLAQQSTELMVYSWD